MTARKRWGALGALLVVAGLVAATVGSGLGGSATNAQSRL